MGLHHLKQKESEKKGEFCNLYRNEAGLSRKKVEVRIYLQHLPEKV